VKPRVRYEIWALLVNVGGLAAVLAALALSAPVRRWGTTAAFLALGSAAAIAAELVHRLAGRRARRQADADVPLGVRLRKPFWLSLGDPLAFLDFGCPLAAAAAVLGFAGAAVGVLLTICLLPALMAVVSLLAMSATDLAFELDGLRVHFRGGNFLVRWNAIGAVEREGPRQRALTTLELHETASAVASVQPATTRNRRAVAIATYDGDQPGGKLTLFGWTGGLDAPVLARAIRAAIGDRPARPN
jgi:hypothetical protein